MKNFGNLAIVCAQRKDVLLQIEQGKATVFFGEGPDRTAISFNWRDDSAVSGIVYDMNHGKYRENAA
jgi:hypothetical protein